MEMDLSRRLGVVKISEDEAQTEPTIRHGHYLGAVIRHFTVNPLDFRVILLAAHPDFRIVPDGEVAPEYKPYFDQRTGMTRWEEVGAEPPKEPDVEQLSRRRVRKIGGSFQHTGTVVSEFKTVAGEPRVVLEFDEPVSGMLHIYRTDQIEDVPE
jgi:hypothetical protein